MVERRQVVIVGAGPVGLLTALGLARQGVEVTRFSFDARDRVVTIAQHALEEPYAPAARSASEVGQGDPAPPCGALRRIAGCRGQRQLHGQQSGLGGRENEVPMIVKATSTVR